MNSSRLIDFSKSSLVGLKAELLIKQEEVKRIKAQQSDPIVVLTTKQNKKSKPKSNKDVEKRMLKDEETTEEDFDTIKKSREMLEAKARLYEKLKCSYNDDETKKSQYLIDFNLKQETEQSQKSKEQLESHKNKAEEEEDNDSYSDSNSDPENNWVDFTDTLGRSRRCLRKDLPEMEAKDAKLAATLQPPSPPPAVQVAPELLSWDMQREIMRQKWEEQETHLLGKKNIHYQDVLYDENRTHGVGYFEFSTNEEERLRQQEALKRLRKETEEQQQASEGLRARRHQQLQSRLTAARRRRRERLGLPPDSPESSEVEILVENNETKEKEENVQNIEEQISKMAPVRPWDIGKQDSIPVMSQEEWIEKKRLERPAEFAPPATSFNDLRVDFVHSTGKTTTCFTSKKNPLFKIRTTEDIPDFTDKFNKDLSSVEVKNYTLTKDGSKLYEPTKNVCSNSRKDNLIYLPISTQEEGKKTPYQKHSEYIGMQSKNWKPTLADIDNLLEKTKEQAKNSCQAFSGSSDYSRNVSTENATKVEENCYQREKQYNKQFYQNNTTSIDTDAHSQMGVIINEVGGDCVSLSTPKNCDIDGKKFSKKYASIPPPAAMSYYSETSLNTKLSQKRKGDMADSLSVGINHLKELSQDKSYKKLKGLLDIM